MARKYAKMWLSAWAPGSEFYDLSADAQWLYWTLVGHPKLTPAGVLAHQPRQWAKRAKGVGPKRITAAYEELVAGRYLLADNDTEEVLIRTFIRHDKGYRTPNIRKSIEVSIARIESHRLRVAATHELTLALTLEGRDGPGDDGGDDSTHGQTHGARDDGTHEPSNGRTNEQKNGRPKDSSFQSSSTSTVDTRPAGAEEDQHEDGRIGTSAYLRAIGGGR